MFNHIQIQAILSDHKKELSALGVRELSLFGSVARGNNKINSDIDLLVKFEKGMKNFDNYINLSFKLEDLLESKVDLLTEESLTENFRNSILSEAISIEI